MIREPYTGSITQMQSQAQRAVCRRESVLFVSLVVDCFDVALVVFGVNKCCKRIVNEMHTAQAPMVDIILAHEECKVIHIFQANVQHSPAVPITWRWDVGRVSSSCGVCWRQSSGCLRV